MKKTLLISILISIFLATTAFAQEASTYLMWTWKAILGLVVLGSLYVIWTNLKPSSVHDTNDIVWVKKERNYLGIAVVVLVVVVGYLLVSSGLGSETTANATAETVKNSDIETIPTESQAVAETEQDTTGTSEDTNSQDTGLIGGDSTEPATEEAANETWDETVKQSDAEVIEKEKGEFTTNMTKKDVEKYMQEVQSYLRDVRRELSNATDIGKKTGEAIKLYGKTRDLFNKATISLRNDELDDAVYYSDETRKVGQEIRDLINEQDI